MKNNGINSMLNGMMNMDRSQLMMMSKFMNTVYNDYGYLTEEDYTRIDEIDREIMNIDKRLYSVITGEIIEEKVYEEGVVENNTIAEPTIASLLSQVKSNISNPYLKLLCAVGELVDDAVHNRLDTEKPVVKKASEKSLPDELLSIRRDLVSERDTLMKTSKERMKKNNPEQYKATQEMMAQIRLQVKNGNFDITSLLGMGM